MSLFSFLKKIFGGGAEAAPSTSQAAAAPAAPAQPERYCLSCHKMTPGTLTPKQTESGKQAMDFTCSVCQSLTQVLA